MEYQLPELLDGQNKPLYDAVSAKIPIVLANSTNRYWGAELNKDKAVITCAESDWPGACFAHELLHIDILLRGLKIPYVVDNENISDISEIVSYIFNILSHLKIYPEFLNLGYPAEQFLSDCDESDVTEVMNRDLPSLEECYALTKSCPTLFLALPTLLLLSPPPHSLRKEYEDRLKVVSPRGFFESVAGELQTWATTDTLDTRFPYARLFKLFEKPRIGFSLKGSQDDLLIAGNQ